MIQQPAPVGRPRRPLTSLVIVVAALAVVGVGVAGRVDQGRLPAEPDPLATASANSPIGEATASAGVPSESPTDRSARAVRRLVIPLSRGPMAVAAGFDHVWVVSAGDGRIHRFDVDGTADGVSDLLSEAAGEPPARPGIRPTIGIAGDAVWVAGIPGPRDLAWVNASGPGTVKLVRLSWAPIGIAGGLGATWVAGAEGELARVSPNGSVRVVLGASKEPIHVAVGRQLVWVSRGSEILSLRAATGEIVDRHDGGGGPIAIDDDSVWVLGVADPTMNLTRIDEASGRVLSRSDVATTGYSQIAWSLPTIVAPSYSDRITTVAPHDTDSVIVDGTAWITRPNLGELWRIEPIFGR